MNREMCYVAKEHQCGCITGIAVDCPQTADDVAEFIKSGRIVERMPCSEASKLFGRCPHDKTLPMSIEGK